MSTVSKGADKEAGSPFLKLVVKRLGPWYGGIVSIYATANALYGWLHVSGLVKTPFQDLLFNICSMVGLASIIGAFWGGFLLALGLGFDDISPRVKWVLATLGAVGSGGWLLFVLARDPRDFTAAPQYGSGFDWFSALLGAAVLVASYVFFGKKLLDRLRSLKTELDKNA